MLFLDLGPKTSDLQFRFTDKLFHLTHFYQNQNFVILRYVISILKCLSGVKWPLLWNLSLIYMKILLIPWNKLTILVAVGAISHSCKYNIYIEIVTIHEKDKLFFICFIELHFISMLILFSLLYHIREFDNIMARNL